MPKLIHDEAVRLELERRVLALTPDLAFNETAALVPGWLPWHVVWASFTGLAFVAAGMAVLIGLSRVYLGVHYLSDVTAGWALGASSFALCAAIALIVTRLRDNPPRMTPQSES